MPSRRVVLFDLGGVLMETVGRDILADLLPEPMPREAILPRWLESPAVKRFESGATTREAFAREFVAEWGLAMPPAAFLESFATWVRGFYDGAQDLVGALRERHTVACLSNTNELHLARFPELASMFDAAFFSHRMRVLKPQPGAYAQVVRALGVPAQQIHFFDDMLPNVEAARAAGMRAWQVAGFGDLAPRLRDAGLL